MSTIAITPMPSQTMRALLAGSGGVTGGGCTGSVGGVTGGGCTGSVGGVTGGGCTGGVGGDSTFACTGTYTQVVGVTSRSSVTSNVPAGSGCTVTCTVVLPGPNCWGVTWM
jgi:hypothetical protein